MKKHFQNSTFTQDITIYAGIPRIDVKMHAGWHEKHILLKVAFPLSAHSPKATYEIPYGTVERPTTGNTPAEQAQFEVPALQWADISDDSHAFSLLTTANTVTTPKATCSVSRFCAHPNGPTHTPTKVTTISPTRSIPTPGPGARPEPSVAATN